MSLPESAILDALPSYRNRIRRRNHRAFSAIIPEIEATVPEKPGLFDSDGKLDEARLEFTLRLIGDGENAHPQITRPSDVLSHWEILAPQVALDGTSVDRDSSWRDEMRDVYTRGVMRGLNERCSGLVSEWEFPADLAVVVRHVDSLEGPGWHKYRQEHDSVVFFQGWIRGARTVNLTEDVAASLARTADEIIDHTPGVGDEYEIAGGWACGEKGNKATCYAVYSRPKDAGGDRSWSWRYVASLGQFGTQIFQDVVELLEWYKSHSEPKEEYCGVTAEEVFQT